MRIVLKHLRKLDVFETPIPNEPTLNVSAQDRAIYEADTERSLDVTCLMLASIVPELQKQLMDMEAFHIFAQLQAMFLKQASFESFETINEFLGMLKILEQTIPSKPKEHVLMVQKRSSRKRLSQRNSLITKVRAKRLPKLR